MKKTLYQEGFESGIDVALNLMNKYKSGHYILELIIRDLIKIKKQELKKREY